MTFTDLFFFIPIIFLFCSSIFNLLYINTIKRFFLGSINIITTKYITLFTLFTCLGLLLMLPTFEYGESAVIELQWGSFKNNIVLSIIQITVTSLSIVVVIFSINYSLLNQIFQVEIDSLLLFVLGGVLLLIFANDFITAYLALELQTIPFYILLAVFNKNLNAIDVSLRYFIMGIIASAMFLFGISLLYYVTGLTNFTDLTIFFFVKFNDTHPTVFINYLHWVFLVIAIIFIFVSLMFKLTAAPFHYWVVDIYDNSPLHVVLFLTTVAKFSIINLAYNFCNIMLAPLVLYRLVEPLFFCFALISVVIGTLGAFNSYKIAVIIGYGSIAHIGFVCFALMPNTIYSLCYALTYFTLYSITTILFFIAWVSIRANNNQVNYLKGFAGLGFSYRIPAMLLSIASFSFSGLPPLAGFIAKLLILLDLLSINFMVIALIFFVLSLISAAYYLRFIKLIWFDIEPEKLSLQPYSINLTTVDFLCACLLSLLLAASLLILLII